MTNLTICDTKECPKAAICLRKISQSTDRVLGFEFTFTVELDQFANLRFNCLNLALDSSVTNGKL